MSSTNSPSLEMKMIYMSLRFNFERASAARTFFDASNTEIAVDRISKSNFVDTAILVRSSILESWTLSLSRMLDTRPRNSDRYTFAEAAHLLILNPNDTQLVVERRIVNKFLALWAKVEHSPRRDRLKNVRDKTIAHALGHTYQFDKASIQDVRKLHIACRYLIDFLGRGTGLLNVSAKSAEQVWEQRNFRYWSQLLN